jgi:hypothetical protein
MKSFFFHDPIQAELFPMSATPLAYTMNVEKYSLDKRFSVNVLEVV